MVGQKSGHFSCHASNKLSRDEGLSMDERSTIHERTIFVLRREFPKSQTKGFRKAIQKLQWDWEDWEDSDEKPTWRVERREAPASFKRGCGHTNTDALIGAPSPRFVRGEIKRPAQGPEVMAYPAPVKKTRAMALGTGPAITGYASFAKKNPEET
jgi:hypothetical protein